MLTYIHAFIYKYIRTWINTYIHTHRVCSSSTLTEGTTLLVVNQTGIKGICKESPSVPEESIRNSVALWNPSAGTSSISGWSSPYPILRVGGPNIFHTAAAVCGHVTRCVTYSSHCSSSAVETTPIYSRRPLLLPLFIVSQLRSFHSYHFIPFHSYHFIPLTRKTVASTVLLR